MNPTQTATASPPIHLRIHLTHAMLQFMADRSGIKILHLKGPALHPRLLNRDTSGTPLPRQSTDADVLVQPDRAQEYLNALCALGGKLVNRFRTGSPFEHAATIWFPHLGYADIHRFFPGIGLRSVHAFDQLWAGRIPFEIANRRLWVPNQRVQRLLLLLHAARSGEPNHPDKIQAWDNAGAAEQAELRKLAAGLKAEVALAAAIGELEQHQTAPEYWLWQQFSQQQPHNRTQEWYARIKAARSWRKRLRLLLQAPRVNTDRLTMDLGHRPSRTEIRHAWFARIKRAFTEWTTPSKP